MQTIQAQVNPRLLSKADRLFTGTLAGRIIEILQNARRAGATEVHITNHEGLVTVHDNGHGIGDFSKLLDLGNSGWDDDLEQAEDPAGVGVFCLAPREVKISSANKNVVITERVWSGEPVPIQVSHNVMEGTVLQFADEPWTFDEVQRHAVFSGLEVTVDREECERESFVPTDVVSYPQLGCKIEVIEHRAMSTWHSRWRRVYFSNDVLINFHGQVVQFKFRPIVEELMYLVDMTGESTGIRLMLPARTQVVENEALKELKDVLERETYRYLHKRGSHRLKYAEYCRARELGITLPEATPTFNVGLLHEIDGTEPIELKKPDEFPLSQCYRMVDHCSEEYDHVNAHLLAALGKLYAPFIPVDISSNYDGYSWAKLPTVERIVVQAGEEIMSKFVWRERLTAVKELQITVHTSDGQTYSSPVPMAVRKPIARGDRSGLCETEVLITHEARDSVSANDIWYHLGGFGEDGDTYDTQLYYFEEQLDMFWAEIVGPDGYLRSKLLQCLRGFDLDWQTITIDSNQVLTIVRKDGSKSVVPTPESPKTQGS